MKPTFAILVAAAVLLGASSAEAARPMAGNSNIIIAPTPPLPAANQFRGAEYAAAARNASRQYRGNRHHEPERRWRPRPANLRRAAGQSGMSHLRSERRTAPFGQLWVSNCPGPGGRRRRASIPRAPTSTAGCSTGFVGRRLEPIASCPLGEAMDWGDEGIFLSAKPLGEANIVAGIFSRAHGRHLGLVGGWGPRPLRAPLPPRH